MARLRWIAAACILALALVSAAPASAAPIRKVAKPAGKARGVVLLFHGGGWAATGAAAVAEMNPAARRLTRLGYVTVNADYGAGVRGLRDVIATYDWAARRWRRLRICAEGSSSGGHLALLLAARRPRVRCVVGLSAPTNLTTLGGTPNGDRARSLAVQAFGEGGLAQYSPVNRADQIEADLLLAGPRLDAAVPPEQAFELADLVPGTISLVLSTGQVSVLWGHGEGISTVSISRFHGYERSVLRAALR
jgi:dipeptidyl aminopeptidase/acylaminoacyl peptidase